MNECPTCDTDRKQIFDAAYAAWLLIDAARLGKLQPNDSRIGPVLTGLTSALCDLGSQITGQSVNSAQALAEVFRVRAVSEETLVLQEMAPLL